MLCVTVLFLFYIQFLVGWLLDISVYVFPFTVDVHQQTVNDAAR